MHGLLHASPTLCLQPELNRESHATRHALRASGSRIRIAIRIVHILLGQGVASCPPLKYTVKHQEIEHLHWTFDNELVVKLLATACHLSDLT